MTVQKVHFSPRELEVLIYVGQCYGYSEIAEMMGINVRTLHKYIERISSKLNLDARVGKRIQQEIISYALRHGYVKQQEIAMR